jgi:hypothetical protein
MAPATPRICVSLVLASTFVLGGAADAGTVTGKLDLPAGQSVPVRDPGFLGRVENPHMPVRTEDPTPYLVVVLEGDAASPPSPGQATWNLLGASFEEPLLPVAAGTQVIIRNKGHDAPSLFAVEQPDLIPTGALNPTGSKAFKTKAPGLLTINDEDAPTLVGQVLVLASPYFALPDAGGRFEIKDVPAGTWKVKVWYRTGWIERPAETITVGNHGKVEIKPALHIPTGFPLAGGK